MTSPRERAQLQSQLRQAQEGLIRDLLPVLDALDRAESHWRHVLDARPPAPPDPPLGFWPRLGEHLLSWLGLRSSRRAPNPQAAADNEALARTADEGIRLIRSSLLDALRGHGLEPFESLGQPFDPQRMRALGQRPAPADVPPGQVLDEAVRGYLWQQTLLREAQVLVAGPP
ncbi:MAG: nucleotide exchange factor GrpE [Cyanobacteriota bacterium]|nr:nucleotide exchange factor GrpE [Cyanobacteriota bacterium]